MIGEYFSIVNSLFLVITEVKCSAKLKLKLKQGIYMYQSSSTFICNKYMTLHKIYINY